MSRFGRFSPLAGAVQLITPLHSCHPRASRSSKRFHCETGTSFASSVSRVSSIPRHEKITLAMNKAIKLTVRLSGPHFLPLFTAFAVKKSLSNVLTRLDTNCYGIDNNSKSALKKDWPEREREERREHRQDLDKSHALRPEINQS